MELPEVQNYRFIASIPFATSYTRKGSLQSGVVGDIGDWRRGILCDVSRFKNHPTPRSPQPLFLQIELTHSSRTETMAPQPLILHAHATGPNPIKIAIALEALKLPYRVQQWEFGDNPERGVKGAAFLKINENGRVPALEDPNTGVVSWESGACMNYIRRVYDKAQSLGPLSEKEQDVVDFEKWEYFLLTTLGPMTGQTNWFRYVACCSNLFPWQRGGDI